MAMDIVVKAGVTKVEVNNIEGYMEWNGGMETARGYIGVCDI